jgi:hypothetical protein
MLTEQDKQLRFTILQSQFRSQWQEMKQLDFASQDILVVPSVSLDPEEAQKIIGSQYFEERLLFYLFQFHKLQTRLIYITSHRLNPEILDYFLNLFDILPSQIKERFLLLSLDNLTPIALTQKILAREDIIEQIISFLRLDRAYMVCYNSTFSERDLAVKLNIPLLALNPSLEFLGTKSGSRQVFKKCNIPYPKGSESHKNAEDLAIAIANLWEREENLNRLLIKVNQGFSGHGNALLDLTPLQSFAPSKVSRTECISAILKHFKNLKFYAHNLTWEVFNKQILNLGAIVELFIEGEVKCSPSFQGYITPDGEVEVLSIHDQIMGEEDSQNYVGCQFPANQTYFSQVQNLGLRIGKYLAIQGVLGEFGIDFVGVYKPFFSPHCEWDFYAVEINLRKSGTTHPFMLLKHVTGGHYNLNDGIFYSQQGCPKYYLAFDKIRKEHYVGLSPATLIDIARTHKLLFDRHTETGVIFHLMGCLPTLGMLGFTSIGNSPKQAQEIYDKMIEVLDNYTAKGQN